MITKISRVVMVQRYILLNAVEYGKKQDKETDTRNCNHLQGNETNKAKLGKNATVLHDGRSVGLSK